MITGPWNAVEFQRAGMSCQRPLALGSQESRAPLSGYVRPSVVSLVLLILFPVSNFSISFTQLPGLLTRTYFGLNGKVLREIARFTGFFDAYLTR